MFGKQRKLPGCIGFVDFEHWYISLERQYGVKPDIKGWKAELEKNYDVEEIAVFGDFSNPGLRGELDKIRDVTPMVFDTKNSSEHYKKRCPAVILTPSLFLRGTGIFPLSCGLLSISAAKKSVYTELREP